MIRPRPMGGANVHPTPVALCGTQWYEVFKQRRGATSAPSHHIVAAPPGGLQGECPTPQPDPKVMGKVRLTTEVPIRCNLEYRHTIRQPRIEPVTLATSDRRRVD